MKNQIKQLLIVSLSINTLIYASSLYAMESKPTTTSTSVSDIKAKKLLNTTESKKIADMTPLHWATFTNDLIETKKLINSKANLFAKTSWFGGLMPVDFTKQESHTKIRNILYFEMTKQGNRSALDSLIEYEANLNMQDDLGKMERS